MAWWHKFAGRQRRGNPPAEPCESPEAEACAEPAHAGQGPATPFPLEVTDVLDLHSFSPREVKAVVETYLEEARARGLATVRIIHGKGAGVQRNQVRSVLSRTPFVVAFEDAPMEAGSWGATVVWFAASWVGSKTGKDARKRAPR